MGFHLQLQNNRPIIRGLVYRFLSALQIGFQKSSYTVEEGDMYLIVCAGLATPVDRSVSVTLSTVYTHSAEGKVFA